MSLGLISEYIDFIGTLMVIYAALKVHHRFLHEHKVDDLVFTTMKNEQFIALSGISMISASFVIDVYLIS